MTCPIGTDVAQAAAILQSGGLVAFATETVYGLGAHALDTSAVARIFEVKQRPRFDPLIVHIADLAQWSELASGTSELIDKLCSTFWPGPLSLVTEKSPVVPDLVTAGLSTVAIRMPQHPVARELLQACRLPIAAPSANPFGQISPTTADHVAAHLGGKIDYILDGGSCSVGLESTVLDVTQSPPVLLRRGGISLKQLEMAVGPVVLPKTPSHRQAEASAQRSPGMLSKHYAPHTPLKLVPSVKSILSNQTSIIDSSKRFGILIYQPQPDIESSFESVEILSKTGSLSEAAANLFAALHRLDSANCDEIIAVACPDEGLGRAINDRLRRASAR